jgi:tetratricopeptide (TPR) repeat protein
VYQALSTVNRTLGRTEKAHHYQIQAYEIAKLHKLSDMVFFSLYVFLKTFQPNENIGYLEEGLQYIKKPLQVCRISIVLAHEYLKMELSSDVLINLEKASKVLATCSIEEQESTAYFERTIDIATSYVLYYIYRKDVEKGLERIAEAEQVLRNNKQVFSHGYFRKLLFRILFDRGILLGMNGEFQAAIDSFEQIFIQLPIDNTDSQYARLHYNLAGMYGDIGEYDKAYSHAQIAAQSEEQEPWLKYYLPCLYGTFERRKENYQESLQWYQKSYDIAQECGAKDKYFNVELHRVWSTALNQAGLHAEAYQKAEKYYSLAKEQQNEKLQSSVVLAEAKHKTLYARLQAKNLRKEKKALQVQKKKQAKELRSLSSKYIYIEEALDSFEKKLHDYLLRDDEETIDKSLKNKEKRGLIEQLQDLRNGLQSQGEEEFKEKVSPEFTRALAKQATENLTPLEERVAILIRAGFPTKQMPAFLHRSDGYLRNIRLNLKKKLPLPPNITLKVFLQQL